MKNHPILRVLVNGAPRRTRAATVADLAAELDPAPSRLLIEHNGRALLRSEWPSALLRDGDRVEILRIAAGG